MVDTLHPPASVVASWPKPNYIDPVTRGPALEYVCIIFSALMVFIVTARVYSRLFITRAPGLDDVLAVFALLFSIALSVLVIIGNKVFFSGRHVWDIPTTTFVSHRINVWASEWCYIVAAALIKISVLLFYRRLSVKFSRAFLVAIWVGFVYNVIYMVGFALSLLLLCDPLYAYWKQFDSAWTASHGYKCSAENIALPASAAFSVLGDLYSTLLPLLLIFNLDLPFRQKFTLYALFALGFLAVAAGIVRTVLLYKMLNTDYDFSWVLWETWIWAVVELYAALFAASAPALKPFFRRFFIESLGSIGRSSRRRWLSQARTSMADRKSTWTSQSSKGGRLIDIEAIGSTEPQGWERGFLRDIEQDETRHFELRASRDGKIIPMQVYKGSMSSREMLVSDLEDSTGKASRPMDEWPISPSPVHIGLKKPSRVASVSSPPQHPLHISLHADAATNAVGASERSVGATRWKTSSRLSQSFEGIHIGPASGSRLDSPSDSEAESGSVYIDEKPPWNTIQTSSSIQSREQRSDSEETLHLPRMGVEEAGRDDQKGKRIGYAV